MTGNEQAQTTRLEPRWPVALVVLTVMFLLALMPGRIRLFPMWFPYILGTAVLVPILAVGLTTTTTRWLIIERKVTLLFFAVTTTGSLASLANLVNAIVNNPTELGGLQLLASSITVWGINVLAFSLLYWQIDRDGPEARANDVDANPDWHFIQADAGENRPLRWRPTYVDYLFLAYSTATALSASDVAPLTSRAKLLMMLESAISLVTMVVVASRAINILGN